MAFAKGKFGITYNPENLEKDRESFPWGIVLALVFIAAAISITYSRLTAPEENLPVVALPEEDEDDAVNGTEPERGAVTNAPAAQTVVTPPPRPRELPPPRDPGTEVQERPAVVRNLLAKLDIATSNRDIEMQIDTLERLRALPGQPAADLDDRLARRLGVLNLRKLYRLKSLEWLVPVTVKRGDSASRIASEHGATLASTKELNGDISKIKVGQKLLVMKNPRFALWVHRQARYADLSLNGKFFKRYYLTGACSAEESDYHLKGLPLRAEDRRELETLLPVTATVTLSEL